MEEEVAKCSSCGSEDFCIVLDEPRKRTGTGYCSCSKCHNVMWEIERQFVDDYYLDEQDPSLFTKEYKMELEATRPPNNLVKEPLK
jgi:hypothetical protein